MTAIEAMERGKKRAETPTFPPNYAGPRRYAVEHPDYLAPLIVAAPNEASALVAAANEWDMDWTAWRFHGKARAYRIK